MANIPNTPIVDYPSPSTILDTILVERTSNKLGNYSPTEPGAPYPKGTHSAAQAALFEGNEFIGQKASEDQEWMARYFGKPPSTQDVSNWEEGYSGETNEYPIFQRRYLEKRDSYTPRTKLTALAGLYRVNVTAAGSGYLSAPIITFSGGTGSGATAIAVLNNSGGIAKITIKAEGNYTVLPSVVITPAAGDAGSGATAAASIQPAGCVLVKEDITGPAPSPYDSLYVVVTRIYETLPGPWLPFTRYDDQLGAIQGRRRVVANTGQVASQTATLKTTYEARDGSSVVSWEIEEARGAGVLGFSAYPTLTTSERGVQVRGVALNTSSQPVAAGTAADSGDLILESVVTPQDAGLSVRRTRTASALPADEMFVYWDFVALPTLLTDIVHTLYCNNSNQFTVITKPTMTGGSSVLRKHRRTVGYSLTSPLQNLAPSTFTTRDIRYQGKIISFNHSNTLNDALSYTEDFYNSAEAGVCYWTESYSFTASTPSATAFAAGAWYVRDFQVEPWGTTGFKFTKNEFFSAAGNPDASF